ncbi:MAG: hypothetical protein ACXU8V_22720, partial [Caulobacteraceae bacterium]
MDEALADRACGECSVCCTVKPINTPELSKAPGIACGHCLATGGCGIYETRFPVCREYRCAWKTLGWVPEQLRPDRSGVLIDIVDSTGPGRELEATLLAFRDPADFERHPVPDIIASLIEQGVLVYLSRPGPPGMLNAKAAVNGRLREAIAARDAPRLLAGIRACAQG